MGRYVWWLAARRDPGSWNKHAAEFVGHAAREAARRRRLAELKAEIVIAKAAFGKAMADVEALEARQVRLQGEFARAPRAEALRQAHCASADTQRRLVVAQERLTQQESVVADRAAAQRAASEALETTAIDLGLAVDRAGLEAARDAITDYRATVGSLWTEIRAQGDRTRAEDAAQLAVQRAQMTLAELNRDAERALQAARAARGRLSALQDSIGATVEQIRLHLAEATRAVLELESELSRLDDQRGELRERVGNARGRLNLLDSRLAEQGGRRATAIEGLQNLASSGLLRIGVSELDLPQLPWAPDPAVRLARRVEQALAATDAGDHAWERVQHEATSQVKDLQDAFSAQGHQTSIDVVEGCLVVGISFHGQQRAPDDLAALLADDVDHRERLLNARERQLLEEHLVSEVASHLQELIATTEAQVEQMNEELRQRPTSTGMRLRLRWAPRSDGPPGLFEARARLLRQVSDAWSLEDREAVSAFLRQQIEVVRAANESGTWHEHLSAAFDYRQWHRFVIERWQDGRWRPATGPASSGERVLAVTLPLFAAASAHYQSAHPTAPRLIMLDEAFAGAGVDDDSRAKSMGLLSTFDLDFMMTSEREWGCYPTIKGVAIHQLARREGIEAVHVTRWEWDGHALSPLLIDSRPIYGNSTNGHVQEFDLAG